MGGYWGFPSPDGHEGEDNYFSSLQVSGPRGAASRHDENHKILDFSQMPWLDMTFGGPKIGWACFAWGRDVNCDRMTTLVTLTCHLFMPLGIHSYSDSRLGYVICLVSGTVTNSSQAASCKSTCTFLCSYASLQSPQGHAQASLLTCLGQHAGRIHRRGQCHPNQAALDQAAYCLYRSCPLTPKWAQLGLAEPGSD